jgi:hypothetical protein
MTASVPCTLVSFHLLPGCEKFIFMMDDKLLPGRLKKGEKLERGVKQLSDHN